MQIYNINPLNQTNSDYVTNTNQYVQNSKTYNTNNDKPHINEILAKFGFGPKLLMSNNLF